VSMEYGITECSVCPWNYTGPRELLRKWQDRKSVHWSVYRNPRNVSYATSDRCDIK
jgi:hypothetical protein